MPFPDPEMRKFLAKGSVESVRSALSAHVAAGMEIAELDDESFTLRLDGREYIGQTSQPLKLAVYAANALFEDVA
jgi:hypothetical protein